MPGAAGPGAEIVQGHPVYGYLIQNTCGNYNGAEVNLTVTGPGVIVVTAIVGIDTYKTANGTYNYTGVVVDLSNSSSDCSTLAQVVYVDGSTPNGYFYTTVPLVRSWNVTSPGIYSYFVDGYTENPSSGYSDFSGASVVGEYFPA
ncbi:MAG TPA: hypothetical protein VEY07_00100 [Thermoplasmata archaeon]|nr:hypothetical protein [Thermoplasmata archaeon]